MGSLFQKSVLMICGDYMEDYEVMVPFQAFQAYGMRVDTVSPGKKAGQKCVTAVHEYMGYQIYTELQGHFFELNADFDDIDVSNYDGLVIPGGRFTELLCIDETVLKIIRRFSDSNKPIATTCHGQLVLVSAGVIKGKKCTAFPVLRPIINLAGGIWMDPEPISVCFLDGNLITGVGWPAHAEFISLFLKASGAKVSGSNKRILFICGDYVEDYEINVPFRALQGLGCNVDAVCPGKKKGDICLTAIHDFEGAQTYSEKLGHHFVITADLEEINVEDYDCLVVPGGRAPEYLAINEKILSIVKQFAEKNKPIAGICHGQQTLAVAGVLKGKKCTAYQGAKPIVKLAGGQWLEPESINGCFTDGNLVTASAWTFHPQFISQLMAVLGIAVAF